MKDILALPITSIFILICLLVITFIIVRILARTIPILIQKNKEFKVIKSGEAIRYINHVGIIRYYTPNDDYIPPSSDWMVLCPGKVKNGKKQ